MNNLIYDIQFKQSLYYLKMSETEYMLAIMEIADVVFWWLP